MQKKQPDRDRQIHGAIYCQLSVHGMSVITTTYFVAKLVNVILLIEAYWPFQHMSLEIYVILTQCVQCPSLSVFFFNYKTGTSNNPPNLLLQGTSCRAILLDIQQKFLLHFWMKLAILRHLKQSYKIPVDVQQNLEDVQWKFYRTSTRPDDLGHYLSTNMFLV